MFRCIVRSLFAQIALSNLSKDLRDLKEKRDQLEYAYRASANKQLAVGKDRADDYIKKARLIPQKDTQLQAIHEAHEAVISKENALEQAQTKVYVLFEEEALLSKVKSRHNCLR